MTEETIQENQWQVIVRESGLEESKAQFILTKFQNFFELAAEWEKKAKTIIVTDGTQTAEMEMARVGRLYLREKRIDVEKTRKLLKEQALREGKAIDGIANVLKALIEPIEDYLEQQEKFVEIREAAKAEARRLEGERLLAEQEAAKAKAAAEEQIRLRQENDKLQAEAKEREAAMAKERAEQEKKANAERAKQAEVLAKANAKAAAEKKALLEKQEQERKAAAEVQRQKDEQAAKERKAVEDKARAEAEKQAKVIAEQKAKAAKAQKEAQAKLDAERAEAKRLADILAAQVECPKCHHKFTPANRGQ